MPQKSAFLHKKTAFGKKSTHYVNYSTRECVKSSNFAAHSEKDAVKHCKSTNLKYIIINRRFAGKNKNNMRKQIFTLLTLALLSTGAAWADETTYDFETGTISGVFNEDNSTGVATSIENISTYEWSSGKKFLGTPTGSTKLLVASLGATKGNHAKFVTKSSFTNISQISFYVTASDRGKTELAVEVSPNADFSSNITTVLAQTTLSATAFGGTSNGTMKQITFSGLAVDGYVRITLAQASGSNNKIMALDDVVITTAAAGYVAAPIVSQVSNTITITSASAGATIYYTLDGTTPSNLSTEYEDPFDITEDTNIKAIAYKGGNNSDVTTQYCGFDKTFSETTFINFSDGSFTAPAGKTIKGISFGPEMTHFTFEQPLSIAGDSFEDYIQFGGGSYNISRYYKIKVAGACKVYIYGNSNTQNVRWVTMKAGEDKPSNADDGTHVGHSVNGYLNVSMFNYTENSATNIWIMNGGAVNYNICAIKVVFGNENSYTATIGSTGYATLALPYAVSIPTGVTAYTGALNGAGDAVTLTQITNGIIPANTGVVINGEAGNYTFNETTSAGSAVSGLGSTAGNGLDISGETDTYYVLAKDGDDAVFALVDNATYKVIPANKAYVSVAAGSAPSLRIIEANNGATNIMNVDDVENAVKFIENGKLYIKKNGVTYDVVGAVVK